MKRIWRITFLFMLIPLVCPAQSLLNAPQKIVIDKKPGRVGYTQNRLLVSNFTGGSLVEIDTLGNQSYFIQGAGFIDGLEVVGNVVYGVSSNRIVLGYNLDSKLQVMNIRLEGLADDYLSSVTYDSTGHLFISCPNTNEIFRLRISDQAYWSFAKDNGLNRPNGILLEKENDRIVVIDDSQGSSIIHAISLLDSTVTDLASTTFDRPDGITRDQYGYYYVGGYYLPGIYQFDPDFSSGPRLFFSGTNMVYPTYDRDDHSLLITYYGDNSWDRIPLTTIPSSIADYKNELILYPAYPNPFRGEMTIDFELEKSKNIVLEIFDSAGSLVSRIVDKEMSQGMHSVTWNALDEGGNRVPVGVYFVRLRGEDLNHAQKLVLTL